MENTVKRPEEIIYYDPPRDPEEAAGGDFQ